MARKFTFLLLSILMISSMTIVSFADIGPKPSVVVEFKGDVELGSYVTLLSEADSTGPFSVSDESIDDEHHLITLHNDSKEAWEAFRDYKDPDGYYFLEYFDLMLDREFVWSYYPPEKFKILVYSPKTDSFAVSEVYERYAFDSYFTARINEDGTISDVEQTYDYFGEAYLFVIRVIATIAVEILVLLLFGIFDKKIIRLVLVANIVTQILLNIGVTTSFINSGAWAYILAYFVLEVLVTLAEAGFYNLTFKRYIETKAYTPIAYAVVANLVSYFIGYGISSIG